MAAILFCAVIFAFAIQSKSEAAGCLRVFFGFILVLAVFVIIRDTFNPSTNAEVQATHEENSENNDNVASNVTANAKAFPFTESSNGYVWATASEQDKMELCRRLARVSEKGNSESFYYDALNAFYNSRNDSVLGQPIDLAVRMVDTGSSALPKEQRDY